MNFSGINYESIADGEGVRVSFFVSGCPIHCPGCFNQSAWSYEAGQPFTEVVLREIKDRLSRRYIKGVTVLGGEPLDPRNLVGTFHVAKAAKDCGKDVWIYTGYTMEQLARRMRLGTDIALQTVLGNYTDVLVEGPYVEAMRDISLPFRGSSNQRIIDMAKTIQRNEVVLYQLHS